MSAIERIGVLGAGAWGTALALVAARAGRDVVLWGRSADAVSTINETRENTARLPGVTLPANLSATTELPQVLSDADALLVAVPAQTVRDVMREAAPHLGDGLPVVCCAKGIETATGQLMSEVIEGEAPQIAFAALSGPGFAADVGAGLPTAVTIAARDRAVATALSAALAGPAFRPYAETDVVGVEIGGAVKNVLAIAAGIVAGRGLGASAGAALIARGFAEIRRLAAAMGAGQETLMGLSGLGDVVLTCTSPMSRNFTHGYRLGTGERMDDGITVEGIPTSAATLRLAEAHGIDMPITQAVAAVLAGRATVDAAIEALLQRPLRDERD